MVDNISLNYDNDDPVDPCCMGCGYLIEEGNVVAFGEGIWHVQCFRCAKCNSLVEHDSNLLLLSDGNPVCENCSYNCHVCRKPILDEAIMTGDESFHVECFRCRQCRCKIDDLIFAKTNQGIYCMPCHNDRVNKTKKAKEKENSNPPSILEKSLPSLPVEAESEQSNKLEPPNHTVRQQRSFEKNNVSPSISPKTFSDTIEHIPKARTLPPISNNGVGRRHSRLFDAGSLSDAFKQKVSSNASKALEQITGKPNGHTRTDSFSDKHKNRGDSSELSKKAGLFSKRVDSLDNSKSKNRGETVETHTRNVSVSSYRSEPYEGGFGRTFSISSQRSDITDILSRKNDRSDTDHSSRKNGPSSSSRKPNSSNAQQSQSNLPHIDENTTNAQLSPPSRSEYYSNTPHSDSPETSRSSSPTSPRSPPSPTYSLDNKISSVPRKSGHFNGLEIGPPVLPPLSFSNGDDDLSKLVVSGQNEENRKKKHRSFIGDFKNTTILNSVDSIDFEGFSYDSPPLSPDRKNSGSSVTSSSSRENEIIITEPEDVSEEELRKALVNTKKKLAEAESSVRKIKRESKKTFDEFSQEFSNEVTLRKKAELSIGEMRAQLNKQIQQIEELKKERVEMEKLIKDSQLTKQQLQEMQYNLKEMDVQKELIIKEIEGLAEEKQAGLAGTLSFNSKSASNLPVSLAKHISTHLDEVKQNYLSEIRSLKSERDALEDETEQLRNKRDQYIEDAKKLNEKNLELAEMNNDLLKQIESQHKSKNHNGFNFFKSSKLPYGHHHHTDSSSNHSKTSGHSKSPSIYNFETDPESASIDSLQKVAHRNSIGRGVTPKKFKWKKGGKVIMNKIANVVDDVKPYVMGTQSSNASNIGLPTAPNENRSEANKRMYSQILDYTMNRAHNWQQFNLTSPVKCDFCHEKMWGVAELKCSGCPFVVHVKCSHNVQTNCIMSSRTTHFGNDSDSVDSTSIFGNDLTKQSELEGDDIPHVVQKCVRAIEVRGMDLEGIYRKSGATTQMRTIISYFEKGKEIDLDDPDLYNDISAVTSVLKQYLRDLPNPLFTYELYPSFIELAHMPNSEEKFEKLRELLLKLPKVNYATAKYLVEHLYRVKQFESKNLMTVKNLSLIFGPTLLRGPDPSTEILDMNSKNAAIEYIIEHANSLFINNGERIKPGFI